MSLIDNYNFVKNNLAPNVQLLVVSKNQTIEDIEILYHRGQRDFGENRVQELLDKDNKTTHLKELRWHMIGHIQNNKIKKLLQIKRLKSIHSADSIELALNLFQHQKEVKSQSPIGLFWELNFTTDIKKTGFSSVLELKIFLLNLSTPEKFYHQGLMAMGPAKDDQNFSSTHKIFSEMQQLKKSWSAELKNIFIQGVQLSMGMSNDYQLANLYESDWVRVGSLIFKK